MNENNNQALRLHVPEPSARPWPATSFCDRHPLPTGAARRPSVGAAR